jgi:long-chain fatty acid transport protein
MGLASSVNAAGFRLSEQDAEANGMGNSFVAVADNASAVWYNPAAMTDLEKTNLSLGTVMVYPTMKHDYTGGSDSIAKVMHVPPYFYATHKLNDKMALGFGFNAPFGLSTDWKSNSATAGVATYSDIEDFNYNLNGAYKVSDKLSVAVGADYMYLTAKLNNSTLDLNGTGHGWGYNAAAMYKLNDKWNFGANYRSPVKIDVDGTAATTALFHNSTGLPAESNSAKTKITLPDTLQIGGAYKVDSKWLVSATADYTDWSTYHALTVKSNSMIPLTMFMHSLYGTPVSDTIIEPKDWQSVWGFHAGTEYKYSDAWKFRAGAFYDYNPVKNKNFDTIIPDSDRVAFSVGAGWTKGNIVVDASYTYLMFVNRTVSNASQAPVDGTYKCNAQLPALSVGYKF